MQWAHCTDVGKDNGEISGCHPMTYGGVVQVTLGKPLKGPLLHLLCEGKLIL